LASSAGSSGLDVPEHGGQQAAGFRALSDILLIKLIKFGLMRAVREVAPLGET